MNTKQVTQKIINGNTYHINQVGLFQKLHLDRQLLKMIAPMIKGLGDDFDLKSFQDFTKMKIDISALMDGITEGLSALSEKEYELFITRLLSPIQVIIPGRGVTDFTVEPTIIDELFKDDLIGLYSLIFEAMKENKLSPFVFMSTGKGIPGTDIGEKNPADVTTSGEA